MYHKQTTTLQMVVCAANMAAHRIVKFMTGLMN
jgi:hypothetical protein